MDRIGLWLTLAAGALAAVAALVVLAALAAPALAQAGGEERLGYDYDPLGRLTRVARSGGAHDGLATHYHHDLADNRIVKWTGAGAPPPPPPEPPAFEIGDAFDSEGGVLSFTVTRHGSINSSYSVDYATAPGTAAAGSDYASAGGSLVFGPDEFSKTIEVATIEDGAFEADETFFVNLSGASGGATILDAEGLGAIANDDSDNQAPVANPDSAEAQSCTEEGVPIDVVGNDTDPDGDYPLVLDGIHSASGGGAAVETATQIRFQPGNPGTGHVHYRVRDARGALAIGHLTVFIGGSECP